MTEAGDIIPVLRPIMGAPPDPVLKEPEFSPADGVGSAADDERSRIVSLLGPTPVAIDDLIRLSGCSPTAVRIVLLELELAGRMERHGGAMVSLL